MAKILNFVPHQKSQVSKLDYDPDAQTLTVQFQNGWRYTHVAVPAHVFHQMTRQPSLGTYYHAVIKRHYQLAHKSTGV